MTYIEFFDKTAAENISTCLLGAPERVIYIGDNGKLMRHHIANYEKIFAARGQNIQFLYKTVSKSNLDAAIALLTEIVQTYDDCVFDLTGGEEILLLALGMVYARFPDKNIQLHKFNIRNNVICDCDKDGAPVYYDTPALSVEENVRIYGGEVLYGTVDEDNTYCWTMDEEFLRDIEQMWSICKGNVRYWNMQIGIFEAVEAVGELQEDGLTTVATRGALEHHLSQHKVKYKKAKGIISALLKCGLLNWFDDSDDYTVAVSYKNPQVKRCLTKAGQALEMHIFAAARSLRDKEGDLIYNDARNGVVIDWDGEFHDEKTESVYDTENEIDILLMHDLVPVFISCKNGVVTADELYKLSAVAERFGGKYAKKVLIATSLGAFGEAAKYFRQRAKDMGIRLIEDVQTFTEQELERKLRSLWSN